MRERIKALHEANPMLGTRGCRLGLQWPEIYEMQVRAIVRAALAVRERTGRAPQVEIMHPLVAFAEELRRLRELTIRIADAEGCDLEYLVGTMIELPRACVRADEIAAPCGLLLVRHERPDADGARILARRRGGQVPHALPRGRHPGARPLRDARPGGRRRADAHRRSRAAGRSTPTLVIGICGEHGGDPASVRFCHDIGLDYVSCSPYRVPVARLAAAQAALAESGAGSYTVAGG